MVRGKKGSMRISPYPIDTRAMVPSSPGNLALCWSGGDETQVGGSATSRDRLPILGTD